MTSSTEAIVRVESLHIARSPASASHEADGSLPWYLVFNVNGERRGWFNESVRSGDCIPIGYEFPVELGAAPATVVQVAGFQDATPIPEILPPLQCTLELEDGLLAVSKTVASTTAEGTPGYAIDVTVARTSRARPHVELAPLPARAELAIDRRHRATTAWLTMALLALALYGAAIFSFIF